MNEQDYRNETVEVRGNLINLGQLAGRWDLTDAAVASLGVMFPGLLEGKLTREGYQESFREDETLDEVLNKQGFYTGPVTIVRGPGSVGNRNQVDCVRGFIYELLLHDVAE